MDKKIYPYSMVEEMHELSVSAVDIEGGENIIKMLCVFVRGERNAEEICDDFGTRNR